MRPPIDFPPMKTRVVRVHVPRRADDLQERLLEDGCPVGDLAALTHVREVEGDHIDAASSEALRHRRHERMLLTGTGPVRQHEQRLRGAFRPVTRCTESVSSIAPACEPRSHSTSLLLVSLVQLNRIGLLRARGG